VSNIFAQNIMSMVAGNVDQIAQIQSLSNFASTLSSGGTLGAPKTYYVGNTLTAASGIPFGGTLSATLPNYIGIDDDITSTPLPGGGALLDGAIVAKIISGAHGTRIFSGGGI
jgi:hypothetical protein